MESASAPVATLAGKLLVVCKAIQSFQLLCSNSGMRPIKHISITHHTISFPMRCIWSQGLFYTINILETMPENSNLFWTLYLIAQICLAGKCKLGQCSTTIIAFCGVARLAACVESPGAYLTGTRALDSMYLKAAALCHDLVNFFFEIVSFAFEFYQLRQHLFSC